MKRVFWIGVGVVVTVVVLRKVQQVNDSLSQVARSVSPAGIAESVSALAQSLKDTATALRESMAENEATLTAALLPSEDELARARTRRAQSKERAADTGWDDDPDAFL